MPAADPATPQATQAAPTAQDQQSSAVDLSAFAQAVPQAIQQSDPLNPVSPTSSTKEKLEPAISLERPNFDQVDGVQVVEQEKKVELSPEIESFIRQVGDQPNQLPQEVVIADQQAPVPTTQYLAKPVIVLPITAKIEKEGLKKSSSFSIRWLVEWSRKVMKVFSGQVIYREAPTK